MLTKDNHHSSYSPKFVAVRYLNIACNASKAAPTAMQMANPSDALASNKTAITIAKNTPNDISTDE